MLFDVKDKKMTVKYKTCDCYFLNAFRKESLKSVLKDMSYMLSNIQVLGYGSFWAFRVQINDPSYIYFLIPLTYFEKVT